MIKNKSFTLIELLVVIVIIGILAGVIMISTSSSIDKANIAKSKVFEESIENNLAANMVSRWKLDEIIGAAAPYTTPDQWGSNTGTLYGANGLPQLRPASECVTGGCFKFDGVDDYISRDNFYFDQKNICVCTWAKQDSYKVARILGNTWELDVESDLYMVRLYNSTTYAFYYSSAYHPTTYVNKWIHWCFSSNGTNLKIYFNGSEVFSDLISSKLTLPLTDGTSPLYIGRYSSGAYFNGLIDDVKIYNNALSSSQIKQNYVAGLNSLLLKEIISKEEYRQKLENLSQK